MSSRWAAVIVVALLITGCGGNDLSQDAGVTVVATTSVLGDVVANVLGDAGTVDVLIPAGVDPHGFEPSAVDARRLREAELVVANGLGLEEGLLDVLEAARADGVPVLRVARHLDPITFDGGGHADGDEHAEGGDGEVLDPHVWFDPVRMGDAVTLIAERLAELDPSSADRVLRNGEDYRQRVLRLHDDVAQLLGDIPPADRQLVTNHDSFGYLAERYDLEVIGTIVPGGTTLGEASSRELTELVESVRGADVPAIFLDTGAPDRLARTVSRELGGDVEVIELYTDSLGPEGSGAETYIGLLETDARRIVDGLTG